MADRNFRSRQCLDYEIKELFVDGEFSNVGGDTPSGITSGLNAEITYNSATEGETRNGDTITSQVLVAADNPTDTVLADVTGDIDGVIITVTPNDGTNNPVNVAPSGDSVGLNAEITYTSATKGTTRNSDTITSQVLVAADNPTDTILADITGDIDGVIATITPNDGTNNPANAAPSGDTSGLNAEITYTSATKGTTRNTDTITSQVIVASANPTDTILADVTGDIDGVIITVTPNDGTSNPANAAPAGDTSGLNAEITYNSATKGTTRNNDTITSQVIVASANPTDTVLADVTGDIDGVIITITPNDGTNNPANTAPTGTTIGLNAEVIYTSATVSAARNDDTITIQVLAAADNPTDTILAGITGTIDAVTITITPNDGTNNGATPVDLTTAELAELVTNGTVAGKTVTVTDGGGLLTDLSATGGDATDLANGGEGDAIAATLAGGITIAVNMTTAELAELVTTDAVSGLNVTLVDGGSLFDDLSATGGDSTVLVDSGEGDGIVATLASGTDIPINITTAELAELVTTGAVAGLNVTLVDGGSLLDDLSATGGDATALADSGEGDGIVATLAGGTDVAIDLTTAELAELVTTGTVAAKSVTLVDSSSLLDDLSASGGDSTVLVDSGEGDGITATLIGGTDVAVNLTTAELVELVTTGAVAGLNVTLVDSSSLLDDLSATGGDSTDLADSGEGDGVAATLAGGSVGSVVLNNSLGILSISRTSIGRWKMTLDDKYFVFKSILGVIESTTVQDIKFQLRTEAVASTKEIEFYTIATAAVADPLAGSSFFIKVELKNSNIGE